MTSAIGQVTGATAVLAAGADVAAKGSALSQALSAIAACVECGAAAMVQLETNVIAAAQATYAAAQAAYQAKVIATGVLVVGSLSEGMAAGIARAPGVPKIDKYMKDVQSSVTKYENSSAQQVAKSAKTFQTYTKTNPTTGEVYCGKTSGCGTPEQNVARRDAGHHMSKKGFGPALLDKSSSNALAIRGREQLVIDVNGGARSVGGTSGNAINSVSPRNPNREIYRQEALKEFGE